MMAHSRGMLPERLTKPSEQGMRPPDAATKTVGLYGEVLQRSYEGFVRRSQPLHQPRDKETSNANDSGCNDP